MNKTTTQVEVRQIVFQLHTYTRNLELCARMNYETEILDYIDSIPKGEVFLDLGACEGRFSIYAAKSGLNVYSFEPDKYNYKVLTENLKVNSAIENLRSYNLAIGSHDHEGKMMIGQPWEGGHQKVVVETEGKRVDLNFEAKEFESINIRSLDSLVDSNELPVPQHLKVDIDGSEKSFLLGATKTLENPQVKSLMFELNVKDDEFEWINELLLSKKFEEQSRFEIPNEPYLFNVLYSRG